MQAIQGFVDETKGFRDEKRNILQCRIFFLILSLKTYPNDMKIPLCLSFRDDLVVVRLEKVACIVADGNYSKIHPIAGDPVTVTVGISKREDAVRTAWPRELPCPMVRLGRSLVVNREYVTSISVPSKKLVLSDGEGHAVKLSVSPNLLKDLKSLLDKLYNSPASGCQK